MLDLLYYCSMPTVLLQELTFQKKLLSPVAKLLGFNIRSGFQLQMSSVLCVQLIRFDFFRIDLLKQNVFLENVNSIQLNGY
ncbi:hypothetical protein BH11BAC1_BH11BAC1_11920 [soil metagenome]